MRADVGHGKALKRGPGKCVDGIGSSRASSSRLRFESISQRLVVPCSGMEGLLAGRRPSFGCRACSSHPGCFSCESCLILHRQRSHMIRRTLRCSSLRITALYCAPEASGCRKLRPRQLRDQPHLLPQWHSSRRFSPLQRRPVQPWRPPHKVYFDAQQVRKTRKPACSGMGRFRSAAAASACNSACSYFVTTLQLPVLAVANICKARSTSSFSSQGGLLCRRLSLTGCLLSCSLQKQNPKHWIPCPQRH